LTIRFTPTLSASPPNDGLSKTARVADNDEVSAET
jgi:hypothetical protein